jgi:hypothetical protein
MVGDREVLTLLGFLAVLLLVWLAFMVLDAVITGPSPGLRRSWPADGGGASCCVDDRVIGAPAG